MANILISYGDYRFKKSLASIRKEAKRVGIFNKIKLYSPKDLPSYIKASPLFAFRKGGGYWLWKPYVIRETLRHCNINDVVYYVDAGCRLNPASKEWVKFQQEIKSYNAIFFQYKSDVIYDGWEKYCQNLLNNSPKILHWMKPYTAKYFVDYFGSDEFLEYNKIMGGIIIIKKTPQLLQVMDQWFKISLFHPELIIDPLGKELAKIPSSFNVHRHDQAILTPLVYKFKQQDNILVLPETAESEKNTAAIIAERRVEKDIWTNFLSQRIKHILKFYLKDHS